MIKKKRKQTVHVTNLFYSFCTSNQKIFCTSNQKIFTMSQSARSKPSPTVRTYFK